MSLKLFFWLWVYVRVVHQEIAPHTTYFCCLTMETCPARVYWTLGGVMQGYNEEVLHWNIRRVSSLSKGESFLTTVWVNGWLHLRSWITRRTLFYYSQLRRRFFRKKSSLPDLRLKTMNLVNLKSMKLISEVLIWILMCAHDQGETCMTCVWLDFSLPYFEGIDALCAVPPGSLYSISTFKWEWIFWNHLTQTL